MMMSGPGRGRHPPPMPGRPGDEEVISFANWPGYIDTDPADPARHPTLAEFTRRTAIAVNYIEPIGSDDQFFARARYASVGVTKTWVDASGGRSIVEEMPGQVNGYGVAMNWDRRGFRRCWVVALGTNDTANVSVGSSVGRMGRIQEVMSAARGQPVLWVNVKSLDSVGPWAESNMQLWNSTLWQACARYPKLRIFDCAKVAQDGWSISDGIHYTSAGYAARAQMIASALAKGFPQHGRSHGCVVG